MATGNVLDSACFVNLGPGIKTMMAQSRASVINMRQGAINISLLHKAIAIFEVICYRSIT